VAQIEKPSNYSHSRRGSRKGERDVRLRLGQPPSAESTHRTTVQPGIRSLPSGFFSFLFCSFYLKKRCNWLVCISSLYPTLRVQESDLRIWAASLGQAVLEAVEHRPSSSSLSSSGYATTTMGRRCREPSAPSANSGSSCRCTLTFCVPWYPCGLVRTWMNRSLKSESNFILIMEQQKFCRGRDPSGKALTYRYCASPTYLRLVLV